MLQTPGGQTACSVLEGAWRPSPMPRDLYPRLGFPNDISWMILSGRNTGSQIHVDPDLMGAWNLLLTGRKWWVIVPTDFHDLQD